MTVHVVAEPSLKKAFSEGIRASLKVVEYEKSQALKPIPKGYCATITGKKTSLDMWEEVKLESLALFLNLKPALFEANIGNNKTKRVLCLVISEKKEESLEKLKEVAKLYPKLDEYVTKVEILPTLSMHRVIPGVGQYFKDRSEEVQKLREQMVPDALLVDKPVNGKIVFLEKKEKNKVVFENDHMIIRRSAHADILLIDHKKNRSSIQ
jgi:hypothetical protein